MNRLIRIAVGSLFVGFAAVGCDESSSKPIAESQPGMGEVVSVDPPFGIKLTLAGGTETSVEIEGFTVYESRPPRDGQPQAPQGYELSGKQFMLAGRLAPGAKVAPAGTYADLEDAKLQVLPRGGDPLAPGVSKLSLGDGKDYVVVEGSMVIDRAFQKAGSYAGLQGSFELLLQETKFGEIEDPNKP
ncbi:MAG TPA: hypothetical protein PLD59_10530, partial [Tepidisphaeraceae bacterium]|nr:hypothetical protein [Tepidisphaeraceae bacterium]